jgi:hypothetical protein
MWYSSVAPIKFEQLFPVWGKTELEKKPFVRSFTISVRSHMASTTQLPNNIEVHTIKLPRFFTKNLIIRCILDNNNSFRTVVTIEKEHLPIPSCSSP